MPDPQVQVSEIETLPQHYAAFAFKHPFEGVVQLCPPTPGVLNALEFREIYELDNPGFGRVSIDVTGIKRGLARGSIPLKMCEMSLTQEWVDYVIRSCGIEEEHVLRLKPSDMRRPGILMQWTPEGNWTSQIDGSHRLVARWRAGLRTWQYAHVRLIETTRYVVRPGQEWQFYDQPEPPAGPRPGR